MKNDRKANEFLAAMLAATMLNNEQTPTQIKEEVMDTRKGSKELGDTLYQSMLGFMDAGFTIEQAFELVVTTMRRV